MRPQLKQVFLSILSMAIIGILILSGCTRSQSAGVEVSQFIPPTLVATMVRTPTVDPFRPTPNPRGPCRDDLTFVDDVTIPDGTVLAPGEEFTKKWEVQNTGSCDWNSRYSVRILSGTNMNAEPRQKLIHLKPGESGIIEITFTAPQQIGAYFSQWQAFNNTGKSFGQDFFVDIVVSQPID